MLKKISNKIIASFTLLIILMVSFLLIFFNDLTRETHLEIIKREMDEKIKFIELVLHKEWGIKPAISNGKIAGMVDEISHIINLRITLVDYMGKVIADSDIEDAGSMDNHRYRIEIRDSIDKGIGESIRYSNTLKTNMLYFAKRSDKYIIRLAKPLYEIDESLSKLKNLLMFFGIFIIVTAVIIIVLISKRITKPVKEALDFAEQFSQGDYSSRIMNYSDDEIGALQRSLNNLADTIVEKIGSLILEQRKLQITIESINDGIAVVDTNKEILIANRAFSSLLDINTPVINRKYFEVIRGSSINSKIEYSLINGDTNYFEEEFLSERFCEVFINPIKEEKTIQGILIVIHDVTEKKRIDQLKTELVGNLSHELKTPITILKGYIETIYEQINNPDLCKDFIKKALNNIDRQNSIINDMLKLNMLETSQYIPVEETDIKKMIGNCIEILSSKASSHEIEIIKSIDTIDDNTMCNRFLSEEVFFNIIDNSISYNNKNGIVNIEAERLSNTIVISISDSGIGIPEESIDRIFERFYRVDKSRSRSTGGTGLGLSIVKHAIEMLNWEISVSSSGKGTTFRIEIPSKD